MASPPKVATAATAIAADVVSGSFPLRTVSAVGVEHILGQQSDAINRGLEELGPEAHQAREQLEGNRELLLTGTALVIGATILCPAIGVAGVAAFLWGKSRTL